MPPDFPVEIAPAGPADEPPYDLLLLADPERTAIDAYLSQSELYFARGTDGLVVGVLVLTALGEGEAEIKNIAVRPAWQGQGIGKRLLEFALDRARRRGLSAVEIGTGNSSLDQLAMYQKIGFRMHRIERDFFTRHYEEPIFENGIRCRDMVMLRLDL